MGFYSLIGFLRPAIYVFLLPLYLSFFTSQEYAIYNLMIDVAAIAMILVSLKLNTAMMTHYYDYLDDRRQQIDYLKTLYTGSLLIGLIFTAFIYFTGDFIFDSIFKDEAVRFFPYGMIVILYTLLFEANQVYVTFLKNEKDVWRFSQVMLTHVISIVVFQFVFIILLDRGVSGALEGILLGNILVTLLIIIREPSLISFKIDYSKIKASLRFSIMLLPYLIIYWFLSRGGRIFLERYTDLETVAVFALLMILSSVILLAVEAVINGVRPFLFEQFAMGPKSDKETISILTKMVINIPLLFVPLIILVACFIHLITPKVVYFAIADYMPLACLLFFTLVLAKLFYQQLLFAKSSHTITMLSFVALLALLLGFVYLIPRYEIWGVIIATIIANSCMAALFYIYAQKHQHVAYSFNSIILTPVIIFGIIFLLQYLSGVMGWSYQLFGIIQFVLCFTLIIILNIHNVREYVLIFKRRQAELSEATETISE